MTKTSWERRRIEQPPRIVRQEPSLSYDNEGSEQQNAPRAETPGTASTRKSPRDGEDAARDQGKRLNRKRAAGRRNVSEREHDERRWTKATPLLRREQRRRTSLSQREGPRCPRLPRLWAKPPSCGAAPKTDVPTSSEPLVAATSASGSVARADGGKARRSVLKVREEGLERQLRRHAPAQRRPVPLLLRSSGTQATRA